MHFLLKSKVSHKRYGEGAFSFHTHLFYFMYDLKKMDALPRWGGLLGYQKFALFSLWNQDHFLDLHHDLYRSACERFAQNGLAQHDTIYLLTQPRLFGYTFNPISLYIAVKGESIVGILCEVGNTFGEQKIYPVIQEKQQQLATSATKNYYISPFIELDGTLKITTNKDINSFWIQVQSFVDDNLKLDALLKGERKELTFKNLFFLSILFPLTPFKIIFLIHWYALKLWIKGVPFFKKNENLNLQTEVIHEHFSRTIHKSS